MLYGDHSDKDGDGELTCADYKDVENQGILAGLLCNQDLANLEKIESLRFAGNDQEEFAISFLDYDDADDFDAVGSWTSTGPKSNRFPGNIRIWSSPQDELQGTFASELESGSKGRVYFDLNHHGVPLSGQISFVQQEDTSSCEVNPSKLTCHYQEIILRELKKVAPTIHLQASIFIFTPLKRMIPISLRSRVV